MKRLSRASIVFAFLLSFSLVFSGFIHANTTTEEVLIKIPVTSVDSGKLVTMVEQAEGYKITLKAGSEATETKLFTTDENSINFNKTVYGEATESSKTKIMSQFVRDLSNSGVSKQGQSTIMDRLNDGSAEMATLLLSMTIDATAPDMYSALKMTNGINGFLGIIVAVLIWGVVVMLMLPSLVDIIILLTPGLQNKYAGMSQDEKPVFVSRDALMSIEEFERKERTGGVLDNIIAVYIKRRSGTFIFVAALLTVYLSGLLGVIINGIVTLMKTIGS